MSDEFDDAFETDLPHVGSIASDKTKERQSFRVARLASRLFLLSGASMRVRMLDCLLRPLGSLGLVAVASGAFANLLRRGGDHGAGIPLEDVGRFSKDQIVDLVRFVEQVSPEALQQLGDLIAESPMGAAVVGASVATLLLRVLRGRGADDNEVRHEVLS